MSLRKKYLHYIGIDEVGRGSLAGPVCAAAVLARHNFVGVGGRAPHVSPFIGSRASLDSKAYSEKRREELFKNLSTILLWGFGSVPAKIIDRIGIERANFLAMERALDNLLKKKKINLKKTLLLIDGNRLNSSALKVIDHKLIIKGDAKIPLIGAASILAKVSRDRLMKKLHKKYPRYAWDKNKGYGTKSHRNAIKKHGPTPLHRKSFTL